MSQFTSLSHREVRPILVGVAEWNPHENFWPHFCEFYAANKAKHRLVLEPAYRMALHKAEGRAVQKAKDIGASHILFVEDDHWGFPVDGLDVLLEANVQVIGLHTFARQLPAFGIALQKIDPEISLTVPENKNLKSMELFARKGQALVQQADLIGFGFTLVRMDVFEALKTNPFAVWGETQIDSQFCQACHEAGIPVHTYLGYTMPHGDCPGDIISRILSTQLYMHMDKETAKVKHQLQEAYNGNGNEG